MAFIRLAPGPFWLGVAGEVPSMIRFQIIERMGANLYKTLVDAMRSGELRTFEASKRGRRIQHKNILYPGWMNWSVHDGMTNCEVISPRKPVASGSCSVPSLGAWQIDTPIGSSASIFNSLPNLRKLRSQLLRSALACAVVNSLQRIL